MHAVVGIHLQRFFVVVFYLLLVFFNALLCCVLFWLYVLICTLSLSLVNKQNNLGVSAAYSFPVPPGSRAGYQLLIR